MREAHEFKDSDQFLPKRTKQIVSRLNEYDRCVLCLMILKEEPRLLKREGNRRVLRHCQDIIRRVSDERRDNADLRRSGETQVPGAADGRQENYQP